MKKLSIYLTVLFSFLMLGCENGGKKVTETKDGTVITTLQGDVYKVIGTEMYEVKKHNESVEDGFIKAGERDIPSKDAQLHVAVKAKVFSEKTNYIITVSVKPSSIKIQGKTPAEILGVDQAGVNGVRGVSLQYEDKDGFQIGEDVIDFNGVGWTSIVDDVGKVQVFQFKGSRFSEKQRASPDTTFQILWRNAS